MNIPTSLNVFKCVIINIHTFTLLCFDFLIIIHSWVPDQPGWTITRHALRTVVQRCCAAPDRWLLSALEAVFIPLLEVTNQLALRVINRLLLEARLGFKVFKFLEVVTVLALQVFKLLKPV